MRGYRPRNRRKPAGLELRNTVRLSAVSACAAGVRGSARAGPRRQIVRDRRMELFCAGTHPFARWSARSSPTRAVRGNC